MELEEKRKLYIEIDNLKREQKTFKRRISVIANLLIPVIGFILYDSGILKGLISFILFLSYNLLFSNVILNITNHLFVFSFDYS